MRAGSPAASQPAVAASPYVVAVSGSPASPSRSTHLLATAEAALRARGIGVRRIDVRELPPAALLHGDFNHPAVRESLAVVEHAQAVLIATPVYKASYAGLLKTFLDLLPRGALAGKPVLPLASGGSLAHLLALDYALRPVLASLGARHVLDNVFAAESDFVPGAGGYLLEHPVAQHLAAAIESLVHVLDDAAELSRWRATRRSPAVSRLQAALAAGLEPIGSAAG